MSDLIKHELYDVLSGKSQVRFGAAICSVAGYLRESSKTSAATKGEKHYKK